MEEAKFFISENRDSSLSKSKMTNSPKIEQSGVDESSSLKFLDKRINSLQEDQPQIARPHKFKKQKTNIDLYNDRYKSSKENAVQLNLRPISGGKIIPRSTKKSVRYYQMNELWKNKSQVLTNNQQIPEKSPNFYKPQRSRDISNINKIDYTSQSNNDFASMCVNMDKNKSSASNLIDKKSLLQKASPSFSNDRQYESKNNIYLEEFDKESDNSLRELPSYVSLQHRELGCEEEESEDEELQLDYLLNQPLPASEDQSQVTVIGNNRMQERTEKTIFEDSKQIWKIKLKNRPNMISHSDSIGSDLLEPIQGSSQILYLEQKDDYIPHRNSMQADQRNQILKNRRIKNSDITDEGLSIFKKKRNMGFGRCYTSENGKLPLFLC